MASVLEIVKQSGRIPLNELALRSSETSERVIETVRELENLDVVRVTGDLPQDAEDVDAADAVVEMADLGSN